MTTTAPAAPDPQDPHSRAAVASRYGVSETVIARIELKFRTRLAVAVVNDPDSPSHLRRRAAAFLTQRGI